MGERTSIEWTEATWNPVRGCTRVSEGCRHCYAERGAARFSGAGQPYEGLAVMTPSGPRWTGQVRLVAEHLHDPLQWTRPRRIFVNSMSDLFHESLTDEDIYRVWWVMGCCLGGVGLVATYRAHTFQVLTKRPARMLDWLRQWQDRATRRRWAESVGQIWGGDVAQGWPDALPNVWLGVSVEDQRSAAERIPLLLRCPAAVRWISAEPLLGPVHVTDIGSLDWVVVGGESGPGARPMHPEWAASLRDQCVEAGVPYLFKQWGDWLPESQDESYAATVEELDPFAAHYFDCPLSSEEQTAMARWEALMAAGPHHAWADGTGVSVRVGKKRAGRTLYGRTWDQYPEGEALPVAGAGLRRIREQRRAAESADGRNEPCPD